jgi:hypothetical protein
VSEGGQEYQITPTGIAVLDRVKLFSAEEIGAIGDFKQFLNDLTLDELLLFIYISYPKYRKDSAISDWVIRKRIPTAGSLYRKGKISLEKAAFLAGLSIENFLLQMTKTPLTKNS